MTLITLITHGGKKRYCSARCYNAKKSPCKCICGGMLHGVGPDAGIDIILTADTRLAERLTEMGRPHFHHIQLPLGLNTEGGHCTGSPSQKGSPPAR